MDLRKWDASGNTQVNIRCPGCLSLITLYPQYCHERRPVCKNFRVVGSKSDDPIDPFQRPAISPLALPLLASNFVVFSSTSRLFVFFTFFAPPPPLPHWHSRSNLAGSDHSWHPVNRQYVLLDIKITEYTLFRCQSRHS
jgi:hypothetical protein